MNQDLFCYKKRFITTILLFGYTFLHTQLTVIFVDVSLEKMIDFSTRMPFAQRVLVPALAHVLYSILPLSVAGVFFILEFGFISLFFFSLYFLLKTHFNSSRALFLSWLFLLLLPLITVINYRFTYGGPASFYYPTDAASLFFITLGFLWCYEQRWGLLLPWIFVATFNRESSILLVFLIPVLHWQHLKKVITPAVAALLLYILARLIIFAITRGTPGPVTEWYDQYFGVTYYETNLNWLFGLQNVVLLVFCFAGMPLFWFAFYDFIPQYFRPIRYLVLFYFFALLFIGNFVEVRIFHEIVILMYVPVCVAMSNWLRNSLPEPVRRYSFFYYLNRYAIFVLLFLFFAAKPLMEPAVNKVAVLSGSESKLPFHKALYIQYFRYK